MREIMFGGETINVLEAAGYNDGYYWDMNAKIEFRGDTYRLLDGGSGSGWIPHCEVITKCDFERLYGEEQGEIDEYEWAYFERTIRNLLCKFIESGAEKSWECREYEDNWDTYVLVDGVKIEEGDEEES